MKVVIIGAGLGGLLSGAYLSRKGYKVEIFERLPIIGGRFTNIDYKGFQLSTGALHMIPHGSTGPLGTLLKELEADVKIVRSDPLAMIRIPIMNETDYIAGYKDILFQEFRKKFSLINQVKLALLITSTRINPPKTGSMHDWCHNHLDEDWAYRLANSFCGWALSLTSKDVSAMEVFEIIENMYKYNGSGIPIGGCKGIIDSLINIIEKSGGIIHTNAQVTEIIVENNFVTGVMVNEKIELANLVISNIGHLETSQLYDSYISSLDDIYFSSIKNLLPSAGVKICLSSDRPLIGHSGILFTPYAKRINGINEVTQIDPNLAPPGKHLIMSHQCVKLDNLENIEAEIELGLADLQNIFVGHKYEILLIQSYSAKWPVNRSSSGTDISNVTPVKGLYIVGDGAKGKGGIEVEGIALGVKNTMNHILIHT